MNKKLDQIHEVNKLVTRPQIHVMSRFVKETKSWQFVGYKCSMCDQTLKTKYLASKHVCSKAKLKRGRQKDEDIFENAKILTTYGSIWEPKYL